MTGDIMDIAMLIIIMLMKSLMNIIESCTRNILIMLTIIRLHMIIMNTTTMNIITNTITSCDSALERGYVNAI